MLSPVLGLSNMEELFAAVIRLQTVPASGVLLDESTALVGFAHQDPVTGKGSHFSCG